MKRIIYTVHAKRQIAKRKILHLWVEESIKSPDLTKIDGHKYYVTKKLNGRTLKVVYVKEKHIKIITSYFEK